MRVMGVDFGEARMGLAVSDPTGFLAGGIGTFPVTGLSNAVRTAAAQAEKVQAEKIVVGYPVNMNGTEGPRAERTRAFAQALHTVSGLAVDLFDERQTTLLAAGYLTETGAFGKKRKATIDTLSAQIILQNYLDRERNRKG